MTDARVLDRADAVSGWRYWQLSPSGLLSSVTQRRIDWHPGRPLRAGCLGGGHRAPDAGCDCGIYGSSDLETLRQHGLCLAPEALVVGTVLLWGKVIDEEYGHRAEYALPSRLLLVPELGLDDETDAALEQLRAYGVPTGTIPLDEAVAGISATTLAFQAMAARASRTRAD
ncbi:MAG: hypothetical protein M3179_10375 [Actinomycetota bacterium]|nr:hypothetical protein [Actinomycetota bacterium]